MRRFGGFVLSFLALMLVAAGCATTQQAAVSRSSVPGTSSTTTWAAAVDTTTSTTSRPADADHNDAPLPTSSPAPATGLDPVPAGTRDSVRLVSSPPPTEPSGPQATGRIEIPAIGLSHETYEGIDLETINHGPSHWPGTARPGHRGNTVFPGHRTTYTRPFWDIDLIVVGDTVTFTTDEGRFTYRVTDTFVVDDEETWIVKQTDNATFTIFGCHPKGSARQRYVVKGELASPPATTTTTTTRPPETTTTTEPEDDGGLLDLFD